MLPERDAENMGLHPDKGFDLDAEGVITDIDRFSTHDGPGIRMAVFLKGCPLRCQWCHSPETQSSAPQLLYHQIRCRACFACHAVCDGGAIAALGGRIAIDREKCVSCMKCALMCKTRALAVSGRRISVGSLLGLAGRDKPYYKNSGGGLTVSGGEPMMQPEFTLNLLKGCHKSGIHTAIETSGHGGARAALSIAAACDLIYYDIKSILPYASEEYTGLGNDIPMKNLREICKQSTASRKIIVRTPCIPGINDSPEEIRQIARLAASLGIRRMEPLKYNAMAGAKYEWLGIPYRLEGIKPREASYFTMLKTVISDEGLEAL
jgi:pyruvate formate lyase activating enzyme